MILKLLKIIMLVVLLSQTSFFRLWDATASNIGSKKAPIRSDGNDTMSFPSLLVAQKISEGVSDILVFGVIESIRSNINNIFIFYLKISSEFITLEF
jgi:hypothetical protein